MRTSGRRQFIQSTTKFLGLGALAALFSTQTRVTFAAEPEMKLLDLSEKTRKDADNKQCIGMAKSLGYVEDLKKSLASGGTKKEARTVGTKTFKPEDQTCETCMFFDYKKDKKDTCQLIPKCLVHKKGSCNSWVPKA